MVYVDQQCTKALSRYEVAVRWTQLFSAPPVVERWRNGTALEAERGLAETLIEKWRERLCDLSWFMKCLNEHLARRANAEDNCDGRFWQGRFRSQALLDDAGLLTAMAYVDLNPIRAGIAATPEESQFTSIYERIRALRAPNSQEGEAIGTSPSVPLRPFSPSASSRAISYQLEHYIELVDWTGRAIRNDKRGAIDSKLPPIAARLNIDAEAWKVAMQPRGNVFGRAMGRLDHLRLHAQTLGQSWVRGLRKAERLYA